MVSVQPINNSQTHPQYKYNPVKITGYGGAICAAACVVQAARGKIKLHKILAYIAGAFTLAHIGIIEYFHHKKS